MKTKKLLIFCAFIAVYSIAAVSCDYQRANVEKPKGIDLPEGDFIRNVDIHFISDLQNATLFTTSNTNSITNKVATLAKNPGVVIVDRADMAGCVKLSSTCASKFLFKAFAFNRIGETECEGSAIVYKDEIEGFSSIPVTKTCMMAAMPIKQIPVNVKVVNKEGTVIQEYTEYKIDLSLNTARLETAEDIAAFSGNNGALHKAIQKDENAFCIGTVKSDLFASLQAAVADGGYGCGITEVKQSAPYSIFFAANATKWSLNAVPATKINGNVYDYAIGLAWK